MSPSFLEFPEDAPQIPLEEERYAYVLSEKGALWLNNNYAHPDLLRGVEFMEGDVLLWPPSLPIARAENKIPYNDIVYLEYRFEREGAVAAAMYRIPKSADLFKQRRSLGPERD